jgi:hypothetical protein
MDRAELMTENTPIKGKRRKNRIQKRDRYTDLGAEKRLPLKQTVADAAHRAMLLADAAQVQRCLLIVVINLTL